MADDLNVSTFLKPAVVTEFTRSFEMDGTNTMFSDLFQSKGRQITTSRTPQGEKAFWNEVALSRGRAPFAGSGSPAPVTARLGEEPRNSTLCRTKSSRKIEWERLFLDEDMNQFADFGKQVLADELFDMRQEHQNAKEFVCSKVLTSGGLLAADFPALSVQKFALNFSVNTLSATSPWDEKATEITGDEIPKVIAEQISTAGLAPSQAIFNDVTYRGFLQNTSIGNFCKNAALAQSFLNANVRDPVVLRGLRVADMDFQCNPDGYKDSGASFTRWVADNRVIFLPRAIPRVLGYAVGTVATPKEGVVIGAENGAPLQGFKLFKQPGVVVFVVYHYNPCSIEIFMEEAFLPVITFPKGVLYFNSKP